jgi:hypothetical protein
VGVLSKTVAVVVVVVVVLLLLAIPTPHHHPHSCGTHGEFRSSSMNKGNSSSSSSFVLRCMQIALSHPADGAGRGHDPWSGRGQRSTRCSSSSSSSMCCLSWMQCGKQLPALKRLRMQQLRPLLRPHMMHLRWCQQRRCFVRHCHAVSLRQASASRVGSARQPLLVYDVA